MLKLFIDMTVTLIQKVQDADAQGNYHDLKEAAHSLKGAARSACLNKLGNLASQLQDDAEQQKLSTKLVLEIVLAFDKARQEINDL